MSMVSTRIPREVFIGSLEMAKHELLMGMESEAFHIDLPDKGQGNE
jgi:hypothetical protein